MRVLSVSPECYPLMKTGGLADVVGALPGALAPHDVDMRVLMPAYPGVRERLTDVSTVGPLSKGFGGDARIVTGEFGETRVLLVDAPHLFDRPGGPYLGPDGRDWPDNHRRFGALSRAAADLALGDVVLPDGWRPDVVHLHDWQAALTAAYLRFDRRAATAPPTVLTIHNLAFQGVFPRASAIELGLPSQAMLPEGAEYWGSLSFLKAGVQWCDRITTVSPTYAREILTPEHGMGFDGLLRLRAEHLTGIVNGLDTTVWDPSTDPYLVAPYSSRRLHPKAENKRALQTELGLDVRDESPLFCVVSRLTTQKGLDLLLEALEHVLWRGAQCAVLGTGDPLLELTFRKAALARPEQIAAVIGYDEALAHRLQAGADAIVVPSRFEPCGLTQLSGLRYGTLPVVSRVGGLADTVIDANEAALRDGVGTGFVFSPVDAHQLGVALDRACDVFFDRPRWQRMQRRAMTRDVGWDASAEAYREIYASLRRA
jgi:starch synthase